MRKTFLYSLVNYLPHAVFWIDTTLTFRGCNKQFARQFGFNNPEDIVGKTDYDLHTSPELIEKYRQDDMEVIQSGIEKLNYEEAQTFKNGQEKIVLVSKVPFFNEKHEVAGLICIYNDITELKQLQRSLQKEKELSEAANQAKTEFLENMRHDIRTPLTGIVGFADLIKHESDKPQLTEYADNLVASSHALLDFLDEVLEAIRVSSGEIPTLKKKFCLKQTLQQVIDLNRAKSAQKNLSLTLEIDPRLPAFLIGDKIRLHRIALELVANALNFTNTGFVKLSASLAKKNQREVILKLMVTDSGIGIAKEKQQDIYVQFKRLTPSYQGIYKGVGLGLSVVKQFIDDMGAEIYVNSELHKGSSFTCLIPLQEPLLEDAYGIDEDLDIKIDKPFETTFAQQLKPAEKKQQMSRVLLVEDNLIAQSVSKSILFRLNCTVDLAETGQKALELWKTIPYDLIFMDIGLPDIDGYEVTHRIRIQEIARKTHVPIIALTAHVGDENKKRCIGAGMNAVFAKPLTLKNSSDILDTFIPGRQKESMPVESNHVALPPDEQYLFNLNAFPLLDENEAIKILGTSELLSSMLQFAVHEALPKEQHELQEAYDALDWNKLQQLAHKIKGGAVYTGNTRLKMACSFIDEYRKSGHNELLDKLCMQLMTVIEDSLKENAHWLATRS